MRFGRKDENSMQENFDEMRESIRLFEKTDIPNMPDSDGMMRYIAIARFMKAVTHQLHLMEMGLSNGR